MDETNGELDERCAGRDERGAWWNVSDQSKDEAKLERMFECNVKKLNLANHFGYLKAVWPKPAGGG